MRECQTIKTILRGADVMERTARKMEGVDRIEK